MAAPKAQGIEAGEQTQRVLTVMQRRRTLPLALSQRVEIILRALAGESNTAIGSQLGLTRKTVSDWRRRWHQAEKRLRAVEADSPTDKAIEAVITEVLDDQPRSGKPPTFTAEHIAQIVAIACEDPQASGYPVSHWTPTDVAAEAVKRGIVESISPRQVGRFLKQGGG